MTIFDDAIAAYINHTQTTEWISNETYKFQFANYLSGNVNFLTQTNEEIFKVLVKSVKQKYHQANGVQFLQKSGKVKLAEFMKIDDVELLRKLLSNDFKDIDWSNKTMSYTGLSAWASSIFPDSLYPIPTVGIDKTIDYLFDTDTSQFPKRGFKYILKCQPYMSDTQKELEKRLHEKAFLDVWNKSFVAHQDLNIRKKIRFTKLDWNWLVQDFHLFVLRELLDFSSRNSQYSSYGISEVVEAATIEGKAKLVSHIRYERNAAFVKRVKELSLKSDPNLSCENCKFSFYKEYGEVGKGYIEAHHITPLFVSGERRTQKEDIALLCCNCHKMIHKCMALNKRSSMTIEEFKKLTTT